MNAERDLAPYLRTTTLSELLVELWFVTADEMREAHEVHNLSGHRMGEALIELGYITRKQLRRALEIAASAGQRVIYDKPKLGEVLVGLTLVDEQGLDAALDMQQSTSRQLGELLVEMGECTNEQIDRALDVQARMMAPVEAPAPEAPAVTKVRVMVVDDSPLACTFVAEGLDFLGYAVSAFQDPMRALEHLHEADIVVTDMNMPGLDGSQLCSRVKETTKGRLPVVILTADEKEAASISLRAGADDYVRKGTSMEELAARLDAILRRTSATAKIRKMFARYTSDAVVEEVLRTGDVVLTGEKRDVTVLFADIRNFTGISESLDAEQVLQALNDVLGRLADAVLACGGTLDKYLGDGLMAVFGAPAKHDDDAERALHAARTMIASVAERNATAAIPLEIGVAINSGTVVVGSIGSERRTEYTCIGDAVNVASRLCGLAGPGEILLGDGTIDRLPDRVDGYEALAPVRLKGKAQPVALYRVL